MFRRMNQYSMIARAALLCASIWCGPSLFAQGLQLSFNVQAPTCFGYTNGTASAVVSGGSGQYGFAWSNAQSGQTNFGLKAGSYTVTVTDQVSGATVVGNVQVTQPTAVQATVVPSGIDCNSNTGTLTVSASGGTGALSFNWSNSSSATSIPVNAPGNYFVTATDANGCAAVANSTVLAPISINMVVNNTPCSYLPEGGSIGAGVSGGQGPHRYKWSNGNTNAVILSQPAGTYTITVTDARNCTAVSTATLTLPPPIVVTIVSVTPACGGNNGSATVSATGGTPPYRFVWGSGGTGPTATGPTATGLAPGIYYVCTFDANNCQLDTWITIEAANGLNLSLVPTHADCNATNGAAAVTVTPANGTYTYAWNVPNTPNSATTVSGIASGTQVIVTVTDVNTGCQGVASTTINTQNTLALNVNKTDIPCSGTNTGSAEGLTTGGTGPITFAWTYPDSTIFSGQQITGLAQGTYHLVATDSKGCKATATANILVLADVNLQVDKSVVATCEGEATLSATAATNATLTWFDANGNQMGTGNTINVPAGTGTTTYKVVASDGSSCTAEKTVTVEPGTLDISLDINNPSFACSEVPVTWAVLNNANVPNVSYAWSAPSGVILTPNNSATPSINAPKGSYEITVTATTPQGCSATMTGTLRVSEQPEISVDNTEITSCSTMVTIKAIVTGTADIRWFEAGTNNQIGTGPNVTVPAGVYTVVAGTASGCTDTENLNVIVRSADVNLAANNAAQACESAALNWSVANLDPNDQLTYEWTAPAGVSVSPNNAANTTVTANAPGVYAVSVTATNQHGCSTTLSAPLNVRAKPTVNVAKQEINACEAQMLLTATATNAPQLVWTNAAGTPVGMGDSITVASGSVPAIYTVTASNGPDCSATTNVTVNPNPVDVSFAVNNPNALCGSNSANWATLNNDPKDNLTFQWTAPSGVTVSPDNGANPNVSANAPGNYSITVTATNQFGCSATLAAPLRVNEQPNVSVSQSEIKACEAQTILSATATGTAQIVWINAAGTQVGTGASITVPSGTVPTVYTAIAGNNICADSAQVRVTPRATDVSFGVNNINTLCNSNTANWTTVNNHPTDILTYQWDAPAGVTVSPNNAANPQVSATAPGIYTISVTATNQHGCSTTLTAPLTINEVPSLQVDKKEQTACGPQATLSATITGASQVVWTNAAGTQVGNGASIVVPSGTGPAVYTVTASNGVGCSVSESIKLTPNPVDISFGGNNQAALCETNTANWATINNDSKDTLTYKWDAPTGVTVTPKDAANPTVTAIRAGNYTITVTATNQYGCTATLTAPVLVEAQQSLSGLIKPDLCDGRSVKFENLTILSGLWDFGDGVQTTGVDVSHIYATAGTYVVRFVPNDKCAKPFDTVINVAATQTVLAGITNNLQNCVGQASFLFEGQATSPNPIQSWAWTFQPTNQTSTQQNPTISFNTEGEVTATLVVRDTRGCADTIKAKVRADIVDEAIAARQNFCPGNSVELNPDFNSAYTYNWVASPADPNLNPKDPNPKVSPEVPTTYTLEVEKGACKATFSTQVEPLPTVALSVPERQSTCDGSPVIVPATGSAGATFTWSTAPNFNPVIAVGDSLTVSSPVGETRYYVRAEKSGECPRIDSTLVINGKVDIEAIGANPTVCKDTETELQVRNMDPLDQLNYAWSNGLPNVFNPTVTPASNSTYSVTVTNQAGCTAALTFAVTVIDVRVTAEVIGKDTICFGEKAQLQANATGGNNFKYAWEPAATLNNSTIPNPMAGPEETTLYTVTVTDDHLCTATANVQVFFVANQCVEPYIFVPKAFTPNGDQNNDFFRVRGNNITELYMVVWNRWGEKVFETNDIDSMGWDGSYKGKEGTPDSYAWLVRARCGNGTMWTKKGDVTLLK